MLGGKEEEIEPDVNKVRSPLSYIGLLCLMGPLWACPVACGGCGTAAGSLHIAKLPTPCQDCASGHLNRCKQPRYSPLLPCS